MKSFLRLAWEEVTIYVAEAFGYDPITSNTKRLDIFLDFINKRRFREFKIKIVRISSVRNTAWNII